MTAHEHAYGWSQSKGAESFVHDHERGQEPHEHVLRDGSIKEMLAEGRDVVKRTTWQEDADAQKHPDGVSQIVVPDEVRPRLVSWLADHRLVLFPIPVSGDDLPTYGIGPKP